MKVHRNLLLIKLKNYVLKKEYLLMRYAHTRFKANLFLLSFKHQYNFLFFKCKAYKELKQHVFFQVYQQSFFISKEE